ncbi:unnamed protein product [Rhodiola kirilowii]
MNNVVAFAFNTAAEMSDNEPTSYQQAISSVDKELWIQAMNEEMDSILKNENWDLVDKPKGQKLVGSKWIFKRKESISGVEKPRLKARLVAKGFTQKEGVDFTEIFSPVVKHRSIRVMLSIVAKFDLELEQLDVKTSFLHEKLDEIIYMRQLDGFVVGNKEEKVCLLKQSLYGLKQSP